jgi:hypothetical protein
LAALAPTPTKQIERFSNFKAMEAEAVEQTTVKSTVDPTVQLAEEYAQYMCVDTPGMHEFV